MNNELINITLDASVFHLPFNEFEKMLKEMKSPKLICQLRNAMKVHLERKITMFPVSDYLNKIENHLNHTIDNINNGRDKLFNGVNVFSNKLSPGLRKAS